jgi:hypothetical protein
MLNQFAARVGNHKPTESSTEKLWIFIITPRKQEIMLHDAVRMGIAERTDATGVTLYETNMELVKVFVSTQGFGKPKFFHNFVLRLGEEYDKVSIYSFSTTKGPLYFDAHAYLYSEEDAIKLEELDPQTRDFMRMAHFRPPQQTLDRLVSIEKRDLKDGIRKLMIHT